MLYPIGRQDFEKIRKDGFVYVDKTDLVYKMAQMYDGYHFRQNSVGVYNPFSVLNTFDTGGFENYWVETATPSFLVRFLQRGGVSDESSPLNPM